jgi:hypothetical protein
MSDRSFNLIKTKMRNPMCKERRNRRHRLSSIIALLSVLALSPCLAKTSESPKPNIVFILADDMNRDSWGIYGSVDCKTPNIDQLARACGLIAPIVRYPCARRIGRNCIAAVLHGPPERCRIIQRPNRTLKVFRII